MAKKTYVLDTSVCLSDSDAIEKFANNDIIIPMKVLEEIDKHKKRQDVVGTTARRVIRKLDSLRERGSLDKGVRIAKGKGILKTRQSDPSLLPRDLQKSIPDNIIIATALAERAEQEIRRKVVMVSRDINMRVICDSLGMPSEDYVVGQVVKDHNRLYSGYTSHLVDEQTIDQFYNKEDVFLDSEEVRLHANQFVMLVSNTNEKKTALARFIDYAMPLDLLMDKDVQVVSLIGKAGSGKTLCAIAAGLEQVLTGSDEKQYNKLVVSRPVQPMGKDIGFLPGTLEEKMTPWLAPIQDNLQFLMGNDQLTLKMYMDKGVIELEALTYIRGRSISNSFIIIDEAQNLTIHEIKTIITRVGEGTKIILTGDIEQIDNAYTDETSNGLAYAVEKFKTHKIAGHITLSKGERSKVATLASKIL